MYVTKVLSHLGAWNSLEENYPLLQSEIVKIVEIIQPESRTSPAYLADQFKFQLAQHGWLKRTIRFGEQPGSGLSNLYAVKDKLGIEYLFGKFAFVDSHLFVKFPLFVREEIIDIAVLIIPMKSLTSKMIAEVSNFEMIENRLTHITSQLPKYPFVILGISDDFAKLEVHELPSPDVETGTQEKPNRQLKVFLCHSSSDKPIVRDLYQKLAARKNIDPWLDEVKLLPGVDWNNEITQAVKESDVVIACLSRASINKEGYVQKEIRRALDVAEEKPDRTIFIIPLRVEECEVPQRLSQWQWVNYYEDGAIERLLSALQRRAKSLGIEIG